ncbi:MAG TPA: hypothetical protein VGP41_07645 [Candidatus Lustribacter sp.]|jgi:hypothetical protein|nr:hypothetical protein [Candidatus Lustribacter sp.]
MNRIAVLTLIALGAFAPAPALAQAMPGMAPAATPAPMSPMPTAAEQPFIAKIQKDIPARFATIAAAQKAGFFQYTGEDKTGAISYVNLKVWNSIDLDMPNQLWYDVNGRLLGVDYTILESQSPKAPTTLFGYAIDPSRWVHRGAHMHYGYTMPDGSLKLGAMPVQKFTDAGGTPSENVPDIPANKAALVKAGLPGLTDPSQVKFVFLHPAMWDLIPWVLPNPDGAWADANPNVKPSQAPPKPAGAM